MERNSVEKGGGKFQQILYNTSSSKRGQEIELILLKDQGQEVQVA
jgi:hypothetical protein